MGERANLLTSHLQAMGLRNSSRIMYAHRPRHFQICSINETYIYFLYFRSWHVSISLAYFPAWVIVALVWHFRIFTATHVVIVLFVHILFGYVMGINIA